MFVVFGRIISNSGVVAGFKMTIASSIQCVKAKGCRELSETSDNFLLRKRKLEINGIIHKIIVYTYLFLDVSRISFTRVKGRFCNESTD